MVIALIGGLPGAVAGLGLRWRDVVGRTGASILAGGLAGIGILLVCAATALLIGLLAGRERIETIETGLGLDPLGQVVWLLIAVMYLPTALGWAMSWLLGGGLVVGSGSLVSLSGTQLGMLPAIPALGALPAEGVAPGWLVGLIGCGVVAGLVAGWVAIRWLAAPGWPLGLAASAAAGAVTAAIVLGWCAASRGDLGSLRLAGLGPRLAELAWAGLPGIVIGALVGGGLTLWLGRVRDQKAASIG